MKHKKLLIFLGMAVVVIIAGIFIENESTLGSFLGVKKQVSSGDIPEVSINYGNIEQVLTGSSLIKELPEDGSILLRFYNFNIGERQWEKSYILKKDVAEEGIMENPDITIIIHSKYLQQMTNKNFCSIVKTAKENGDWGIESELSTAKLLWKFKGMLKYRECFGF